MCRCYYSRETRVILQRPFPIYELDMNSGNAVSAGAARSNRRVRGNAPADQPDKTALRYLQRREDGCSFGADVLGHRLFTFSYLTVNVDHFQSHVDRDVV